MITNEVSIRGLVGSGTIEIAQYVKQGRGWRKVAFELSPEAILRLADALRATRGLACATETSQPAGAMPGHFNVGHAVWHCENPQAVMPCIDPSKVIDMRALTAGDGE